LAPPVTAQAIAAFRLAGFAQIVQAMLSDRPDDSALHLRLAVFARNLPPAR
jgi:hypothetical protein